MNRNQDGSPFAARASWLSVFLLAAAVMGLLWPVVSQATNGRNTATDADRLNAALATIERAKAQARAQASKALAKELTPLERDWGIKLHGIRWTSTGYMLCMRMRILDPELAAPLLRHYLMPYVIVEKSGAVLQVPFTAKMGSLRASVRTSNMVKKDRIYSTLFANPGRHVKPGDKVTLVIGNFMAEHLTVQ